MESLKVLIVDDEPIIRMDLRASLEDLGVEVVGEAADGKQAIDMSRSLHPDLVVMDIMMPQMDGLEAARVLRHEEIAPVMLLTGYAEDELVGRADAAGVLAYLRKPFRKEDLLPAMSIALGRYRERLELAREVDSLKEKMEARKIVGRAKALLMERYNLTEREAFHRIQSKSQTMQKPPHEIAKAIIMASELGV
jgi:two-component system, response regulator PdtaR